MDAQNGCLYIFQYTFKLFHDSSMYVGVGFVHFGGFLSHVLPPPSQCPTRIYEIRGELAKLKKLSLEAAPCHYWSLMPPCWPEALPPRRSVPQIEAHSSVEPKVPDTSHGVAECTSFCESLISCCACEGKETTRRQLGIPPLTLFRCRVVILAFAKMQANAGVSGPKHEGLVALWPCGLAALRPWICGPALWHPLLRQQHSRASTPKRTHRTL